MTTSKMCTVVAKIGDGKWLPLYIHSSDVEGVATRLMETFISSSFYKSCNMNSEDLKKLVKFIAFVHDIGKVTAFFQYRITKDNLVLRDDVFANLGGVPEYSRNEEYKHALSSELILNKFGCPKCISTIVGAHHGMTTKQSDVVDCNLEQHWNDIVGNDTIYFKKDNINLYTNVWKDILEKALIHSGYTNISNLPKSISKPAQMILTGLLIMADWIASNTDFFPLVDYPLNSIFYEEEYLNKRKEQGWIKLSMPEMWHPNCQFYDNELFKDVFGFAPNSVQKDILKVVNESTIPGIYILEAPMGIGKTEAALSVSEILATRFEKNGLFFGLPTQATANGIFQRIVCWGEIQSKSEKLTIQLKHSGANLNKDFIKIKNNIAEDYSEDSGLQVHSWFCNSKKACLSDFIVATVDQMLMMALKRKHVMLLHLGLSEKVVVIDECHAFDAFMNKYLYRALQWLGEYKVPVILLSATLPADKRVEMVKAYTGEKQITADILSNTAYPLLTWSDSKVHQKGLLYDGKQKLVNVTKGQEDSCVNIAKKVLDDGGCVGIILNTVKRSQTMCQKFLDYETLLYHSRYLLDDRSAKEGQLLARIGKKSTKEARKGLCVIGTQVLEQSLDIDFDLLITDIAPMDLLLQRIGRLHRHKRDYRPSVAMKPTCIVMTDEILNDNTGSQNIYTKWLLETTMNKLPDSIDIPGDISFLVQEVYGEKQEEDLSYVEYVNIQKKLKREAESFLLADSKGNDIHNLLDRDIHDNDAYATVRYGENNLEVLAFMQIDNNICYLNGEPIPQEPGFEDYTKLATQKLRLPNKFFNDRVNKTLENNKIDILKKSSLTYDFPVLIFDEKREVDLLQYKLTYSFDYGLIIK